MLYFLECPQETSLGGCLIVAYQVFVSGSYSGASAAAANAHISIQSARDAH